MRNCKESFHLHHLRRNTDKKEKKIFPIYKEIQKEWSSCKDINEEGLPNVQIFNHI